MYIIISMQHRRTAASNQSPATATALVIAKNSNRNFGLCFHFISFHFIPHPDLVILGLVCSVVYLLTIACGILIQRLLFFWFDDPRFKWQSIPRYVRCERVYSGTMYVRILHTYIVVIRSIFSHSEALTSILAMYVHTYAREQIPCCVLTLLYSGGMSDKTGDMSDHAREDLPMRPLPCFRT